MFTGQVFVAQPHPPVSWSPSAPPHPYFSQKQGSYYENQVIQSFNF